jgi:hypothetical protein
VSFRNVLAGVVAVLLLLDGLTFVPAHAASSRACDAWARDYARNASRQGQVVRRGTFGALVGLGIGAATGGAAAGAAIGGGVGALSGTHARQRTADQIYWAAYRDSRGLDARDEFGQRADVDSNRMSTRREGFDERGTAAYVVVEHKVAMCRERLNGRGERLARRRSMLSARQSAVLAFAEGTACPS